MGLILFTFDEKPLRTKCGDQARLTKRESSRSDNELSVRGMDDGQSTQVGGGGNSARQHGMVLRILRERERECERLW